MDNGTAVSAPIGTDRRPSSSSTSSAASKKQRKGTGIKSLVEYTSEVSSEDFSGPEDGEVDSPTEQNRQQNLVANASPINDDEDIDLGGELETNIGKNSAIYV